MTTTLIQGDCVQVMATLESGSVDAKARKKRYLSVCSGIEAASKAWSPLGWEPVAFAEIEPAPSAVLRARYPHVRNLGDFTSIRTRWARRIGVDSIDVLVGGTPCQSFSVAGLRGGMADARGNLALEFLRLARRFRPQWVVWENVPGVHSSWTDEATFEASEESRRAIEEARRVAIATGLDLGTDFGPGDFEEADQTSDFGCFLDGLEELGYGWAYRILDAQFFGVPQRRRRVFVVGYSGDPRRLDGPPSREDIQRFSRVSAAVLFERFSLSGNPPPSRAARTDVAGSLGGGSGERGWRDDLDRSGAFAPNIAFGLQASTGRNENGSRVGNAWNTNYIAHTLRAEGFDASEDGTGRGTPLVPIAFGWQNSASQGDSVSEHVTPTLDKSKTPAVAFQCQGSNVGPMGTIRSGNGNTAGGVPFIIQSATQGEKAQNGLGVEQADTMYSLTARDQHAVAAFDPRNVTSNVNRTRVEPGLPCPTLHEQPMSVIGQGVRRLTPVECERLQGFPDDWTLVEHRGKPMADGPRYKMCGNSMAVVVMNWLGYRIDLVEASL